VYAETPHIVKKKKKRARTHTQGHSTCASFSSNLRMISWVFILLATWKQHMHAPSQVSFFDDLNLEVYNYLE